MLVKKRGIDRRVITPWSPSWLSIRRAIDEERKINPIEKTPTKRIIPHTETKIPVTVEFWKNSTPMRRPKARMIIAWMKAFVTPERPMPRIMWVRGMGLTMISGIRPKVLSNRRLIPPKRLVKRVVMAITPAAMNVR